MGKRVWTCLDGAAPKVLWVHNGGTEENGRDWDRWGSSLEQLNRQKEKGSQKWYKSTEKCCLPCDLGILNQDKGAE